MEKNLKMRRIKLIKTFGYSNYDSEELAAIVGDSDWEECSDEDISFLQSNIWRLNYSTQNKEYYHILLEDCTPHIPEKLKDIKNLIAIEIKKSKERNKKEEELKLAKKKKREQTKIEKAKKLLEEAGVL